MFAGNNNAVSSEHQEKYKICKLFLILQQVHVFLAKLSRQFCFFACKISFCCKTMGGRHMELQ